MAAVDGALLQSMTLSRVGGHSSSSRIIRSPQGLVLAVLCYLYVVGSVPVVSVAQQRCPCFVE